MKMVLHDMDFINPVLGKGKGKGKGKDKGKGKG